MDKQLFFIEEVQWILGILENEDSSLVEINWESGRGTGKNVHFILAFNYWATQRDLKINYAVFRKQTKDIKDLFNDFQQFSPIPMDVEHKNQKAFLNGNLLTFNSLYTSSNTPQASLGKSMNVGADYVIIWSDEATQIEDKDRKKLRQAYARFGKKMIIINTWNPWSPHNEIVRYMADYLPYPGVEYMEKNHYQMKRIEEKRRGRPVVKYFLRTSAYFNPFASEAHLMTLEEIAAFDEDEGNTILWAKPGVISGAVYKKVSKCAVEDQDFYKDLDFKKIIAGVDFGTQDATSVTLLGVSSDNRDRSHGLHILSEYYHQNEKGKKEKTLEDYAIEVLDYLVEMYNKYDLQNSDTGILHAYVDYAKQSSQDVAFIDILQQMAREEGITEIRFHKAKKTPIRNRITLTNYLISSNRFTIDAVNAPNHLREYTDSYYDTSKVNSDGFHPRVDINNHAIDSSEYAINAVAEEIHRPSFLNME